MPSQYRVKEIVHNALQSHARELTLLREADPNNHELISAKHEELGALLEVFDEIISSSYCDNDAEIPILDWGDSPKSCAFCGGELFRSIFLCSGGCVRDNYSQGQLDCGIALCISCYIDGRTCKCTVMSPRRLLPLADLLKLRKDVHELSLALGDSHDGDMPPANVYVTSFV